MFGEEMGIEFKIIAMMVKVIGKLIKVVRGYSVMNESLEVMLKLHF